MFVHGYSYRNFQSVAFSSMNDKTEPFIHMQADTYTSARLASGFTLGTQAWI